MLCITLDNGNRITWHLGSPWPLKDRAGLLVKVVRADWDELAYIKEWFDKLPWVQDAGNERAVSWTGDHAKFIILNWPKR